jgi:hypothetical protein
MLQSLAEWVPDDATRRKISGRSPDEAKRNPGQPLPHCTEFVIGRRLAPTRWLHAGYVIATRVESSLDWTPFID